jgi:putative pyruvate formate lyase activating enzyme
MLSLGERKEVRGPMREDAMNLERYRDCHLCPRGCGADRVGGKLGLCRQTATCRISFAGPHYGEEPSFTGACGSGTIFFSGCSCRCFFCQNYQISTGGMGWNIAPDELVRTARSLALSGVHNLNFVTPDHFWPHIQYVCRELKKEAVSIPTIYNSSGYQRPDLIEEYAECIDIFMPDFKFARPELARECMGDERYPEIALNALQKMVERKGFLDPWDPTGVRPALRGVLVRHLILPGHVENSLTVLRRLREEFGKHLPLSLMSQFHPIPECLERRPLNRGITHREHEKVRNLVYELDFQNVYLQEIPDTADFRPDFSLEEPFERNTKKRG